MRDTTQFKWMIAALTLCMIAGFSAADTENALPDRLQVEAFSRPVRPAAVFSHDNHNAAAELDEDCAVCHHAYDGKTRLEGETSEDSPCAECHGLKPTPENSVGLRKAFHTRCKSCHFQSRKGPVLCGECHIRKVRTP